MRRFFIIFVVAAIAGIINGAIIFNLTHQYGYATEVMPAIMAMSESDKTLIVDSEQDYNHFSAFVKDHNATDYTVYTSDNIPESAERMWLILSSDNPKKSENPDNMVPGFYKVSEIISDTYTVYELEKL